ncbi:Hypothetical predicted protein, partial [Paramuricea clavata]
CEGKNMDDHQILYDVQYGLMVNYVAEQTGIIYLLQRWLTLSSLECEGKNMEIIKYYTYNIANGKLCGLTNRDNLLINTTMAI